MHLIGNITRIIFFEKLEALVRPFHDGQHTIVQVNI